MSSTNSSCPLYCDGTDLTREIELLGQRVRVKNYICSRDGVHYFRKPEHIRLQLSVSPVSFCPGACPFCVAQGTKLHRRIDMAKFERVMRQLKAEDRMKGVKITGGEPFYDFELLNDVVALLFEVFGTGLELSISTNGMWIEKLLRLNGLEHVESVHISRHHYDDEINRRLFGGAAVPDSGRLRELARAVPSRKLLVFNCMLLKGYIDSPEEARRFMDYASETGVPKVGFMDCMPINAYAREHRLSYEDVLTEEKDDILFTRAYFALEDCHCQDGVYLTSRGRLEEFYGRSTQPGRGGYCRTLVYEADDHLRDGFGGNILT